MSAEPLPKAEDARLRALIDLDVLDSPLEIEFDALVQAAAAVCGVPIALISLIDADRQWFKADLGLPGVSETSRDLAFCAHAIRQDGIFEAPDATRDQGFAGNPLVTDDPSIRFDAVATIRLNDGANVGTVCVIDREPRQLDARQREVLMHLATAAARALEGRRALLAERELHAALASRAASFRVLSESSPIGVYATDAYGACTYANTRWQEIYGLSMAEAHGDGWTRSLHPEDRAAVFAEWQRTATTRVPFDMEFRIHQRDGGVRQVRSRAQAVRSPADEVTGYAGAVEDVTEHRNDQQRLAAAHPQLQRLYEQTTAMLHSIDAEGRLLTVSDRWLSTPGYRREEVIGRISTDFQTPASREHAMHVALPAFLEHGLIEGLDGQMLTRSSKTIDVLCSALMQLDADGAPARALAVVEDVTARNTAMRTTEALLGVPRAKFILSITDATGAIIDANPAFCVISGYAFEALMAADHSTGGLLIADADALARIPTHPMRQIEELLPHRWKALRENS